MPGRLPEGRRPPADFRPVAVAKELAAQHPRRHAGDASTAIPATRSPRWSMWRPTSMARRSSWRRGCRPTPPISRSTAAASILLAAVGKGDPLAHPRLTVLGALVRSADARLRRRFLARHPKSALYVGFRDFSFWRIVGRLGPSQRRLRPRRRSRPRGRADRSVRRRRPDRRGGERDRAHECRSRRGGAALCDEARRRGGGPVAGHRHRSRRARSRGRRSYGAARVLRNG